MEWFKLRVLTNYKTTIVGMSAAAVTAAASQIAGGQYNQEALVSAAIMAAAGAFLKDEQVRRLIDKLRGK